MRKFVVGFVFDMTGERMALIQKQKPKWQSGLLNGIGGSIDMVLCPGDDTTREETPKEAMTREFAEEAGALLENWGFYAVIQGEDELGPYEINCFRAFGIDLDKLQSKTVESIVIVHSQHLPYHMIVPDLKWLVPLALDSSIETPLQVRRMEVKREN